jgi:hypothetical protein
MDFYIGYCPNLQYGAETGTFPLHNFPDFPGRNAFVEVSGRGEGGRIHSISKQSKFVTSCRGEI